LELATNKKGICVAGCPWQEKINAKLLPVFDEATLLLDKDYNIVVRLLPFDPQPQEWPERQSAG